MMTKALLCKHYGSPEMLTYENLTSDQSVKAGQVRIKSSFIGMNFPDTLFITGQYQHKPELPFSPCGELSGIVTAKGKGVTEFNIGDAVFAGGMIWGCARTSIDLPLQHVYRIPKSMPAEEAAVFCCVFGTAIHCLKDRAELKYGEKVAILGAAGGLGSALIQIAKIMGCEVIACASTQEKLEYCRSLGADYLINYTNADLKTALKTHQPDVVCDPVGSLYSEPALRSLAWDGRFMVLGFTAGKIAHIPLNLPLLKGCRIVGVFWSKFAKKFPNKNRTNIRQALQWYEQGKITIHIDKVIPFSQAADAFYEIKNKKGKGKIVLDAAK